MLSRVRGGPGRCHFQNLIAAAACLGYQLEEIPITYSKELVKFALEGHSGGDSQVNRR